VICSPKLLKTSREDLCREERSSCSKKILILKELKTSNKNTTKKEKTKRTAQTARISPTR